MWLSGSTPQSQIFVASRCAMYPKTERRSSLTFKCDRLNALPSPSRPPPAESPGRVYWWESWISVSGPNERSRTAPDTHTTGDVPPGIAELRNATRAPDESNTSSQRESSRQTTTTTSDTHQLDSWLVTSPTYILKTFISTCDVLR